MDRTIDPNIDYVQKLAAGSPTKWPAIRAARVAAREVQSQIATALEDLSSTDATIVAFGSLARLEWTSGSDVDWTLLIDGSALPDHRKIAREIESRLVKIEYAGRALPRPGAEGIFGKMAFSHEIIHHIGGNQDSNRNTTQRILLLLESIPLRAPGSRPTVDAYERVVRQILYRYLQDDTNFYSSGEDNSRIPRFLLNDIVRYWRTMCVDFAYKEWEQAGGKWAIRNIKLRMSRKLLFVSGLLTVFSCSDNPRLNIAGMNADARIATMQEHLLPFVSTTPLDIVASTLLELGLSDRGSQLLDCYDQFVARIDDGNVRIHLQNLAPADVYGDRQFLDLRELSHRFQDILTDIFYREDTPVRKFIVDYGVF